MLMPHYIDRRQYYASLTTSWGFQLSDVQGCLGGGNPGVRGGVHCTSNMDFTCKKLSLTYKRGGVGITAFIHVKVEITRVKCYYNVGIFIVGILCVYIMHLTHKKPQTESE